MLRFTLKRFLGMWPTLLLLVTLAFFMMRMAPGGPFSGEVALHPQIQANLEAKYHFDKPLIVQYGYYLAGLLKGDLGPSFKYRDFTVNQLVKDAFPVSLRLGLLAMFFALTIGITLGSIAALRQNSLTDYSVMAIAMFGISVPSFVFAPIMVLIFALTLQWLPAGGWDGGAGSHLILPVIALALPQIAIITRIMRGSMIEILRSNFVRTAKAKGLSNFTILTRHALRPAIVPVVSYLGPAMAGIITGSVVVEQIFNLPGLGRLVVLGALNRDYTLVLGLVILIGTLMVVFNFIVDLLYAWLDPKVRYGQENNAV